MRKHNFDDYEVDVNELRDNDERYQNSEICEECGAKMERHLEKYECGGAIVYRVFLECENPSCGEIRKENK